MGELSLERGYARGFLKVIEKKFTNIIRVGIFNGLFWHGRLAVGCVVFSTAFSLYVKLFGVLIAQ